MVTIEEAKKMVADAKAANAKVRKLLDVVESNQKILERQLEVSKKIYESRNLPR